MVADNERVAKLLRMEDTEPSDEDFEGLAIKEFGRIEIPLRDRYAFKAIAEELSDLAHRLTGLQHDARFDSLTACSMAQTRVRACNRMVKQARLKNRLPTKSSA